MLSGSLNDPDGGDRKGGGNGRGVRFAKSPIPVSKRYGSFGNDVRSSSPVDRDVLAVFPLVLCPSSAALSSPVVGPDVVVDAGVTAVADVSVVDLLERPSSSWRKRFADPVEKARRCLGRCT